MSIISSIKEYIQTCPLLEDSKINIDYLPDEGFEISVDTSPVEEVVKQYLSGGAQCQYVFNIRTVKAYGADALEQIESSGFIEDFERWIYDQNRNKNFPILSEGYFPVKIETMSTGYLATTYADLAQYQIQCRLIYLRKGN